MRFLHKHLYDYYRWPISSTNLGGREYVSYYRDRPFLNDYIGIHTDGFNTCNKCILSFSSDEFCMICYRCIICCSSSQLENCQVCNSSNDLTRHWCYRSNTCLLLCRDHVPKFMSLLHGCGCPYCVHYCINCKHKTPHVNVRHDPFLLSTCPNCKSSRAKELQILKPSLPLDLCKIIISFYGYERVYLPLKEP